MIINIDFLLSVLFECSVFGVFLYVVQAGIRTLLIPFLHEECNNERKGLVSLRKKEDLLIVQQKNVEKKLLKQQEILAAAERKMKQWHARLSKKRTFEQTYITQLEEKIKNRYAQQVQGMQQEYVYKQIVPYAIERVRNKLLKEYKGEQGARYMNNLIVRMSSSKRQKV